MLNQQEKADRFRTLHERGTFVIPNPWDIGSARLLASLGFEALATTSSGHAYSLGRLDGDVGLERALEHCRALAGATQLPVSADFENAFAAEPRLAAANILRAAETGIAGCSIEDFSGDADKPIYDFELAVERVAAAVEAVRGLDFPFTLTARAENLLHGVNDLDDTIRRLQAFEAAGADVLYAPGLKTLDEIRTVVGAVGRPINVLGPMVKGATVADMAAAGVRRISTGGALANVAIGALLRAGEALQERGDFGWTADAAPRSAISEVFATFVDSNQQ
ncbi:MAG TPA: isocitrate lyase/phosphoenolpyruvate mutase family protein [Gammaproteobacteria bacterium]|nr:isocitrate lyase/phosphoenolpyruvate mutase family protein [Gammaproteobacteria bacterium]